MGLGRTEAQASHLHPQALMEKEKAGRLVGGTLLLSQARVTGQACPSGEPRSLGRDAPFLVGGGGLHPGTVPRSRGAKPLLSQSVIPDPSWGN